MLHTGLTSVTFRSLTPEEVVDLVQEAQLDGIEWGGDVHVPPGDEARARRVARVTEDAGLRVSSYGSYFRLGEDDPRDFAQVVETTEALGTDGVRVWAGRRGSAEADGAYWERVVHDAAAIAAMARPKGISVSFEYHRNTLTDSMTTTLDLLQKVDAVSGVEGCVQSYWQTEIDSDPDGNVRGLKRLLPRLSHVHVFHWQPGHERRLLDEGKDAWRRYVDVVASSPRSHWLILEFVRDDHIEAFEADARTLRALVARDR